MGWIINKITFDKNPNKYHRIANKDITVYQMGIILDDGGCFHPVHQEANDFFYKPNILNEKQYFIIRSDYCSAIPLLAIENGYYSYSKDCYIRKDEDNFIIINDKNSFCIGVFEDVYIGKLIIPQGSEYYVNYFGEIVSSQLIWTGEYYETNNVNKPIKLKNYVLDYK